MKWRQGRRSANVEDRRGAGRAMRAGGIGGFGLLIVIVLALFFKVDPTQLLQDVAGDTGAPKASVPAAQRPAAENESADFASVVLADTEDTWSRVLAQKGMRYEPPRMVLFTGRVNSACGMASAATGPFYCPADRKVYLDLSFFDELKRRFHAPGDFAEAYVIAHEVGHHVQNLLGISSKVHALQRGRSKAEANSLSVRLELQADCFAGVWAYTGNRERHFLEAGDLEEALGAASAVGDDRIQQAAQGYVVPDSFTHGSARQRQKWFSRGFETGDLAMCDTFSGTP